MYSYTVHITYAVSAEEKHSSQPCSCNVGKQSEIENIKNIFKNMKSASEFCNCDKYLLI